MHHPIHRIAHIGSDKVEEEGLLVTACGPELAITSLDDGTQLGRWTSAPASSLSEGPPVKKRRTEQDRPTASPDIVLLHVAGGGQHVVIVTGEDKCIHVLSVNAKGNLEPLSRRCMPKRPSALTTSPDNQYILVADKFGDVYSLPLLVDPETEAAFLAEQTAREQQKPYKPAATTLTVHSQRNLKALEQQLKQQKAHAKTREPLRFSHQLLLGHVSMLTDLLSVRVPYGEKHRDYIITADRDEHIRVSRGIPQAHITESYCLGHKAFVSKLCMVNDLLVSGDGDGRLHVWEWKTGRLVNQIDIKQRRLVEENGGNDAHRSQGPVPVSGLWVYPNTEEAKRLLVAFEGQDTLFYLEVDQLSPSEVVKSIGAVQTGGNILDLAVLSRRIILSVDNYHVAGTVDRVRVLEAETPKGAGEMSDIAGIVKLQRFCVLEYSEQTSSFTQQSLGTDEQARMHSVDKAIGTTIDKAVSRDLVYGLHSLRKRGGEDGGEEPS